MDNRDNVKIVTATEFNKQFTAVYKMLEILQNYAAIHITRHGKLVLVIHKPDAQFVVEQWADEHECTS